MIYRVLFCSMSIRNKRKCFKMNVRKFRVDNGVFWWNKGQSRSPFVAHWKYQPLLLCFITLGHGLLGYEFEIILILADISRFCPSSRNTGSDREVPSLWMFMDWRTACCWGITDVSDMEQKIQSFVTFLEQKSVYSSYSNISVYWSKIEPADFCSKVP